MPNPIKEALLGRGWAGKTISRAETVERLNPLLLQFLKLNHYYQSVIRSHPDTAVAEALKRVQKTARADVGKLSESILSAGGTPENGTDLEPDDFTLDGDEIELLSQLKDLEATFNDALTHERGENATLEKVGEESTEFVLAAKSGDREEIAHEAADIVYHLLVVLAMHDMTVADLRAELAERRS